MERSAIVWPRAADLYLYQPGIERSPEKNYLPFRNSLAMEFYYHMRATRVIFFSFRNSRVWNRYAVSRGIIMFLHNYSYSF